jgi:basic membrane protein A and related proteins
MNGAHVKVGLIVESLGLGLGYGREAYLGMERAVRELGVKGRVLVPAPKEGYAPSLVLCAQQGYDLILAIGFRTAAAVDAVASRFPETRFAIIDAPHHELPHRPKNVQSLVFAEEEASYLAGCLAALMVADAPGDHVISSVGGQPVPAVERLIAGYQAGAKRVDPGITTLNSYTDSFLDRLKGRSVALSQIARRSRVLFQVAGTCGLGALEAAKEHGVWGIGVDVDQSELGSHILTSVIKRLDIAVFATIEKLVDGTYETGGTSRFSLRDDAVGLGAISDKVPGSTVAEVERVAAEILAGDVTIPTPVK